MPDFESRLPFLAIVKGGVMYRPSHFCKRRRKPIGWSAQMYTAFVGECVARGQDGMRCALVLSKATVSEGCFTTRVSRASGSTIVSSYGSTAGLAVLVNRKYLIG